MNNEKLHLVDIYYQESKVIKDYNDIFIETNKGVLKVYAACVVRDKNDVDLKLMNRLRELDVLRKKYGELYIEEVRKTYDNDMYILVSKKFILVIEYIPSTESYYSNQVFRIIEGILDENKSEYEDFMNLDLVIIDTA